MIESKNKGILIVIALIITCGTFISTILPENGKFNSNKEIIGEEPKTAVGRVEYRRNYYSQVYEGKNLPSGVEVNFNTFLDLAKVKVVLVDYQMDV